MTAKEKKHQTDRKLPAVSFPRRQLFHRLLPDTDPTIHSRTKAQYLTVSTVTPPLKDHLTDFLQATSKSTVLILPLRHRSASSLKLTATLRSLPYHHPHFFTLLLRRSPNSVCRSRLTIFLPTGSLLIPFAQRPHSLLLCYQPNCPWHSQLAVFLPAPSACDHSTCRFPKLFF